MIQAREQVLCLGNIELAVHDLGSFVLDSASVNVNVYAVTYPFFTNMRMAAVAATAGNGIGSSMAEPDLGIARVDEGRYTSVAAWLCC